MKVPFDWEITGIARDYLRLSDAAGPVLELKWSPAPPSYSIQRGGARILKKKGGNPSWQFRETPLPLSWQRNDTLLPVTETSASAFNWQTDAENGVGLLCHIPDAACVALLCFHPSVAPAIQEAFIQHLGFHQNFDTVQWSVFDIKAETPADFHLTDFHFVPGEFKLAFIRGRCRLTLWRWSPASTLTETQGLEGFVRKQFSGFDSLIPIEINEWQGFKWKKSNSGGRGVFGFLSRFFPKKMEAGLIWHQKNQNRLLAVHMESRKGADLEVIHSISRQFQCR